MKKVEQRKMQERSITENYLKNIVQSKCMGMPINARVPTMNMRKEMLMNEKLIKVFKELEMEKMSYKEVNEILKSLRRIWRDSKPRKSVQRGTGTRGKRSGMGQNPVGFVMHQ